MLDYKIYLKDIIEHVTRIERSLHNFSKGEFLKNLDIIDATLMRVQVIGESIKKLPLDFKKKHGNIQWGKLSQTRDIISHAYSKVNTEIIWDLITNKLPKLKEQINKII